MNEWMFDCLIMLCLEPNQLFKGQKTLYAKILSGLRKWLMSAPSKIFNNLHCIGPTWTRRGEKLGMQKQLLHRQWSSNAPAATLLVPYAPVLHCKCSITLFPPISLHGLPSSFHSSQFPFSIYPFAMHHFCHLSLSFILLSPLPCISLCLCSCTPSLLKHGPWGSVFFLSVEVIQWDWKQKWDLGCNSAVCICCLCVNTRHVCVDVSCESCLHSLESLPVEMGLQYGDWNVFACCSTQAFEGVSVGVSIPVSPYRQAVRL